MNSFAGKRVFLWVGVIALALMAGGCWEEEPRKPRLEKGVYPGEVQPPLGEDIVRSLQRRTKGQRNGGL